jgi:molecular chaperone HtpG
MVKKNIKKLIIGKHILDTLSIGMYNNPLMLFREYIQNSVDSIDQLNKSRKGNVKNLRIEIIINGRAQSITIQDNATGIRAKDVLRKLHDIGRSSKKVKTNRGFRGIGRLGGLGYCEELRFITKAKNESIYSVSKWDCAKLRKLISGNNDSLDATKLVESVAELSQYKYTKNKRDHFFIVEMYNVRSSRNVLLDVPVIKSYLSQVVPAPFKDDFSHKREIERALKGKISNYKTYEIFVNGEQVYKPYINSVKVGDRKTDRIRKIDFIEFSNGNGTLTFGWIANLELLGRVNSTGLVDGVRLRSGNILVGDKDLLCDYFRERRFNSYLVGELHVVDHRLVLNSRRDDFEDSQYKEEFYNFFIKEIGLPFSRKIREVSEGRSQNRKKLLNNKLIGTAKNIISNGYIAERQKEEIIVELARLKDDINGKDIDNLLALLNTSVHFLDLKKRKAKISSQKKIMLKSMFDIVYKECTNKEQAGKIVNKIVKQI